jgi:ketosteroid isomerase-like protein
MGDRAHALKEQRSDSSDNRTRSSQVTRPIDPKTIVRRYFAALQRGDEQAIRDAFANDATWTLAAGDLPMSGTAIFTVRDGKIHAVREYMDTLYAGHAFQRVAATAGGE